MESLQLCASVPNPEDPLYRNLLSGGRSEAEALYLYPNDFVSTRTRNLWPQNNSHIKLQLGVFRRAWLMPRYLGFSDSMGPPNRVPSLGFPIHSPPRRDLSLEQLWTSPRWKQDMATHSEVCCKRLNSYSLNALLFSKRLATCQSAFRAVGDKRGTLGRFRFSLSRRLIWPFLILLMISIPHDPIATILPEISGFAILPYFLGFWHISSHAGLTSPAVDARIRGLSAWQGCIHGQHGFGSLFLSHAAPRLPVFGRMRP